MWRLGVVGSPVSHSLSPQLHEAALRQCSLVGQSTRVEMSLEQADSLRELIINDFEALSVTMPLKAFARSICDEVDDVARRLGVVNSLRYIDRKIVGINTDGHGFVDAITETWGIQCDGMHVVVLGSGGAAVSIIDALHHANVSSITVLARNSNVVEELVNRYSTVHRDALVYRPVDLLINTTPVVGRPTDSSILQGVSSHTFVVDITYEPRESAWLALHRKQGCLVQNGLPMLAYQAARQCEWWFGTLISGSELLGEL